MGRRFRTATIKAVGTRTPDANVLTYENGVLYAVGTGTATLTVNGTTGCAACSAVINMYGGTISGGFCC